MGSGVGRPPAALCRRLDSSGTGVRSAVVARGRCGDGSGRCRARRRCVTGCRSGWTRRRVAQRAVPAIKALDAHYDGRRSPIGSRAPEELETVLREALRDPSVRVGVPPARGNGRSTSTRAANGLNSTGGARRQSVANQPVGVLRSDTSGWLLAGAAARGRRRRWPPWSRSSGSASRSGPSPARGRVEPGRLVQIGYRGASPARARPARRCAATAGVARDGVAAGAASPDDGTVDVDGLLDQRVAELGTAVAELRTIAHGLRPQQPRRRPGRRALADWCSDARRVTVELDVDAGRRCPTTSPPRRTTWPARR